MPLSPSPTSLRLRIQPFSSASCSLNADISACSSTQTGVATVLIVLTLIIWAPGFVLVLLADIFALIRTALVRHWGWFTAILAAYFFLWNVAMLLYVFIGPDEPPARFQSSASHHTEALTADAPSAW